MSVDTPAAINRQAWAWLQEFLRDLKDDMAHRASSETDE